MALTQKAIEESLIHPVEVASQFHKHFFILVKMNQPMILIEKQDREKYIGVLKACRDERNLAPIVDFYFKTAIKKIETEIVLKKEMTKDNGFDYLI